MIFSFNNMNMQSTWIVLLLRYLNFKNQIHFQLIHANVLWGMKVAVYISIKEILKILICMTACVFAMKIIYEGSYYRCYKKQGKN